MKLNCNFQESGGDQPSPPPPKKKKKKKRRKKKKKKERKKKKFFGNGNIAAWIFFQIWVNWSPEKTVVALKKS